MKTFAALRPTLRMMCHRLSCKRVLVATALAAYVAVVFGAFVAYEAPGLGIGHFFYIPIALLAFAAGPKWGAFAGVTATGLYICGAWVNPHFSEHQPVGVLPIAIRLAVFTGIGVLIGWAAQRNRDLTARLRELADRDHLTGLLNTRAFESALDERLRAAQPFSLVLADVDDLKAINDSEGHAAGNDYLIRLAAMLRAEAFEGDVARIGGDEFAVLLPVAGDAAVEECRRLQGELAAAGVSASFGWSSHPEEGEDALTLFHVADKRLYDGKLAGERRPARRLRSVS